MTPPQRSTFLQLSKKLLDAIKSLRETYSDTQTALVILSGKIAEKVFGKYDKVNSGEFRQDWAELLTKFRPVRTGRVICRVRAMGRPTKCFKC